MAPAAEPPPDPALSDRPAEPANALTASAPALAGLAQVRLEQTVLAAAQAIAQRGASRHTVASYRSAAEYWQAWHHARFARELALPLPVETVITFLVDHVLSPTPAEAATTFETTMPTEVEATLLATGAKAHAGPLALATVEHRLAFMAAQHRLAPFNETPNPCHTEVVRRLMRAARVSYAIDQRRARPPEALDAARLEAVLQACEREMAAPGRENGPDRLPEGLQAGGPEGLHEARQEDAPDVAAAPSPSRRRGEPSPKQVARARRLSAMRDRALLLFAFSSGGRRRSEVSAATLENTRCLRPATADEPGSWAYTLGHAKTNQTGAARADNVKPIQGRAAAALEAWLTEAGIASGAIFRRVSKWGRVTEHAITPAAVREIVKLRCAQAGLDPAKFSAHSLRSGFVTEAGRRGVPAGEGMQLTGHRSVQVFMRYYRLGDVERSAAARLMDLPDTAP